MPVIDASVYVALINANEEAHMSSWNWFRAAQAAQEQIVAPAILLPEVAAAISRGVGDTGLAVKVVEQLENTGVIEIVSITQVVAQQAARIAAEHRIRGCDAVYVALADQTGSELITLDRQQIERSANIVKVRKP